MSGERPVDEPFLGRWSRLKREQLESPEPVTPPVEAAEQPPPPLTDADMPPIESLTEASDYRGFLSPEVSDSLRQLALRKLFHSTVFNHCDGLDDYAEDYTTFEKLGDIVTADMKHRMERLLEQESAEEEAAQLAGEPAAGDPVASAETATEATLADPDDPSEETL